MTLYTLTTLDAAPSSDETLAKLARALEGRCVGADRRVLASSHDSRSPDEGLALLDAYVSIAEPEIRQAILDAVLAIAEVDPYRRSRSHTGRKLAAPSKAASRKPIAREPGGS